MLSLTINGVNFTTKWRVYESRWTSRAHMGESFQSEFIIDDEDGTISHLDLASKKIVEVWEDASGSAVCMYRGRVANKTLGRGMNPHGVAMRWTVTAEDYNLDLRGLRVTDSTRPEESDRTRVLAYAAGYLNGAASTNPHARDSTELGTAHVVNASLITLIEQTYTDTYPVDVFTSICEFSAKTFFVFVDDAGDGQLYYANLTDTSYLSDIEINDNGSADGQDVFSPYKTAPTGEHDGQRVVTGGGVRYGSDDFFEESDQAGGEAFHDKWEEHFTDEFITTEADADRFLLATVTARSNEDFTYIATIDMQAEDAHRIKAGMIVPTRIASANLTTLTNQRAVQVTHEPQLLEDGAQPIYKVTIELGMPRTRPFQRNIRRKPGPFAPSQPTAGACTRLYPSSTSATLTLDPAVAAGWDAGATPANRQFKATADSTYVEATEANASFGDVAGVDVIYWRGAIEMGAALAAVIAAGGATIRGQFRTKTRHGIGIDEEDQDMVSQLTLRVTQGDSTTIRGTPLALNTLASTAGSARWDRTGTQVNRVWPPAAAGDTLSAVSGTVAGDYLLIEMGSRNFTISSEPSGGTLVLANSGGTDLPEDDLEGSNLNSWIEICSASSAGDSTSPTVQPGASSPGTSNVFSPIDHSHSHGLLADDGIHHHDADQIDGLEDPSDIAVVTDHGTMGATETFDFTDGSDHEGILDANLTVTLTGATADEAAFMTLVLTQDGTGTNTIDLPASVVNAVDIEAAFDTAADAVNILTLFSYDGGTSWYAFLAGGSTSVGALDDLSDVTLTAPAEHDTLRYDGAEWVNENTRWEPVTENPGAGPELVWDGDDLVMEWKAY